MMYVRISELPITTDKMTYDQYNCYKSKGLDGLQNFFRSAYGIALFDMKGQLTEDAIHVIKGFMKIICKKFYVAESKRLFIAEDGNFITHAKTKREKIKPVEVVTWEQFIDATNRLDKKDIFLQALKIIESTKGLNPVISGLFAFAALTNESTEFEDVDGYLRKLQKSINGNFGIGIITGEKSFDHLLKAVDKFVEEKNAKKAAGEVEEEAQDESTDMFGNDENLTEQPTSALGGKNHPDEIIKETPKQGQGSRKRTHEEYEAQILPSVSDVTDADFQDDTSSYETRASKRPRMIREPVDETSERTMFTRSEPVSQPNYSQTPLLNTQEFDQQPSSSNNFVLNNARTSTPMNWRERDSNLTNFTPNSSPIPTLALSPAELERQQKQLEKITNSWFSFKNNSEEKFIKDHMFDTRSKELGFAAHGIDTFDLPASLISHLNPSIFTSSPIAASNKRAVSQSFEIDEEPDSSSSRIISQSFEMDDEPDVMPEPLPVARPPQARSSFCNLM